VENKTHNFTQKNNQSIKFLSVNAFFHTFTLRFPVIVIDLQIFIGYYKVSLDRWVHIHIDVQQLETFLSAAVDTPVPDMVSEILVSNCLDTLPLENIFEFMRVPIHTDINKDSHQAKPYLVFRGKNYL
jgi:hypothetical protein